MSWLTTIDDTSGYFDSRDMHVTPGGDVYMCGVSFYVWKCNSDGDLEWVANYNYADGFEEATDLVVDGSGNVYAAGQVRTSADTSDYAVAKFSAGGDVLWAYRYDGPDGLNDVATGLALDSTGDIIVTGYSETYAGGFDVITVRLQPDGGVAWTRTYQGPLNYDEMPYDISAGRFGDSYITGWIYNSQAELDMLVLKYSPQGQLRWEYWFDSPGNEYEEGHFVFESPDGHALVVGQMRYFTLALKLQQCECFCHADPSCDGVVNDIVDVVRTIEVAFRSTAPSPDSNPTCPWESADVDCSGAIDLVDVIKTVNVAFRGANATTEYCDPCP